MSPCKPRPARRSGTAASAGIRKGQSLPWTRWGRRPQTGIQSCLPRHQHRGRDSNETWILKAPPLIGSRGKAPGLPSAGSQADRDRVDPKSLRDPRVEPSRRDPACRQPAHPDQLQQRLRIDREKPQPRERPEVHHHDALDALHRRHQILGGRAPPRADMLALLELDRAAIEAAHRDVEPPDGAKRDRPVRARMVRVQVLAVAEQPLAPDLGEPRGDARVTELFERLVAADPQRAADRLERQLRLHDRQPVLQHRGRPILDCREQVHPRPPRRAAGR